MCRYTRDPAEAGWMASAGSADGYGVCDVKISDEVLGFRVRERV